MTNALRVPTIDLSAPTANAACDLDEACRRVGFFQVVGHDVDQTVLDGVLEATARFFSSSAAVKAACVPPSPELNRGYAAKGTEGLAYSVGLARPPDLFEAFNVGPDNPDLTDPAVIAERHRHFAANMWPVDVAGFREAVVAWFAQARQVADRVVALFAPALGLPDGWFDEYTSHSTDTMRINHYETRPGDPDPLAARWAWASTPTMGSAPCSTASRVPTALRACRSSALTLPGTTCEPMTVRCSSTSATSPPNGPTTVGGARCIECCRHLGSPIDRTGVGASPSSTTGTTTR